MKNFEGSDLPHAGDVEGTTGIPMKPGNSMMAAEAIKSSGSN